MSTATQSNSETIHYKKVPKTEYILIKTFFLSVKWFMNAENEFLGSLHIDLKFLFKL